MSAPEVTYKPGDFKTDLKPVWCPGCGDFGVLNALYRAMASLSLEPWNTVILSGIGCSSRLPGYVATYGFNSVHGRALALATGVKVARPDLTVIAVGGDGDGMAIGGNHLMHSCRRNLDVTYILMDNEIYGLTKGQTAPTTPTGDKTKSSYWGNPEPAVDPVELAISTGATFVARGFSGDLKNLTAMIQRGIEHRGFSFINVMSPCVTWRGDSQYQLLKAKLQELPEDYDPTNRASAVKYTRETDVLTTGVLYEAGGPTIGDRVEHIRMMAQEGGKVPTTREILERFMPSM
ncbi:MAG: 2-oxoacid:ferredoxin oxidoreductase subunit beta [Acidobacteria bacterium]|jgi:2-oxoglutarate/2-oxoacid ferredoxin oxidoreductase subunit beta|nr:2-oxoacid:ferredoxin oxidoreductase subunit beta [Acidobacteriota bacterium]